MAMGMLFEKGGKGGKCGLQQGCGAMCWPLAASHKRDNMVLPHWACKFLPCSHRAVFIASECLDIPQHLEVDIVGIIQGLAA